MHRKYNRLGRETLEVAETIFLPLFQQILKLVDDGFAELVVEWPSDLLEDNVRIQVLDLLDQYSVEQLQPIEDRCRRIRQLAADKGPSSLSHVTAQRLAHDEIEELETQLDALCKSAWVFLNHPATFADAEAFHGARQYRDLGKMYDAFEVEPSGTVGGKAAQISENDLASLLTAKLELPSRVVIRTLDLVPTDNHAASVLVIVRHAGPLSSVLNHKENGLRSPIYYRPPNEATLIWTPSENTIEICGPSPQVRRAVAEGFAQVVFKTDLSTKPLTWRYYDLSRFHKSLKLLPPVWDDVEILATKVIAVEMRLGNWSRRLSLKVTIDDDIEQVAQSFLGGSKFLKRAEGFSLLTVAVKYKRRGEKRERTMEISFGDRRSNLQSKTDAGQRELGHRLLQHWGILNKLQPLQFSEIIEILPNLLALHDVVNDAVSGGRLRTMGLDPKRLIDAGVIAHRNRSRMVLLDEGDEALIEIGPREGEMLATDQFEEVSASLGVDDTSEYEIKRDWLEEIVINALRPFVGKGPVERLSDNLGYFGKLTADGGNVPVYLVRCLDQMDALQSADLILRSRQDGGVGVVLAATETPLTHLGPNVVVPLPSVLAGTGLDDDAVSRILDRHKTGRWLALGGAEVALMTFGPQLAMLYIPSKVPLAISGAKQARVMERLVAAHKSGAPGAQTGHLVEGTGVKSPSDAWKSTVRSSVVGVYFEHAGRNLWRLKVD